MDLMADTRALGHLSHRGHSDMRAKSRVLGHFDHRVHLDGDKDTKDTRALQSQRALELLASE